MTVFDGFNVKVGAIAGLCGAAIALSPDAAAAPLKTGGYACMQGRAGDAAAPAAGGPALADGVAGAAGAAGTGNACLASAPLTDMSGVPLVAPGPIPVVPAGAPLIALGPPVPAGAPLPLGAPPLPLGVPAGVPMPVVPAGAPLVALAGAPVDGVVSAPIIDMDGAKDAPTGPAPTGGPVPGQPVQPGPSGAH